MSERREWTLPFSLRHFASIFASELRAEPHKLPSSRQMEMVQIGRALLCAFSSLTKDTRVKRGKCSNLRLLFSGQVFGAR